MVALSLFRVKEGGGRGGGGPTVKSRVNITLFYCQKTLPLMMLFACWVDVWLLNVGSWMDEHDKCARYISRGLRK